MLNLSNLDVLQSCDLTELDLRLWADFVAANPTQKGPYFDIRYVMAIATSVPHTGILRFRESGKVVGYFPYQIRSGVLQPMAAPVTDYHGIIARPGFVVDFNAILKATGTKSLEFQGWVGTMSESAELAPLTRRVADASQGYDHWYTAQIAQHHKFFKNIERCQRNIIKDFGGFEFSWERVTPELLDWTLSIKRKKYRTTGLHDIFACGWTRNVISALADLDDDSFGLRAGVFRDEGRIVASEISLTDGRDVHFWFPAYDVAYSRYSVGILLTMEIIRTLAPLGFRYFDFGTGGEHYKFPLTSAAGVCFEGELNHAPHLVSALIDMFVKPDIHSSIKRRLRVIRATEVSFGGWSRALACLGQRGLSRLQDCLASRSI